MQTFSLHVQVENLHYNGWHAIDKEARMYVVSVTIYGKPEFREALLEATLDNARNTRKHEPGNIRYDVSQKEDDPNQLHLFEVYKTKDDFAKHQQTPHYLRWKEKVADWQTQPRVGVRHKAVFFGNDVV